MAYGYANPYGAVNAAISEAGKNIRWIGSDISANKRSQAQLGLQGSQMEVKKAQVESNIATQQKKMEFLVQQNEPTSGEDLIRLFYAGNPKKAEAQIKAFQSVEGGKNFLTDLHSPRDAAIALKGVTNQAALDAEIAKDSRTQTRSLDKESRSRESKRVLAQIKSKTDELEGLREMSLKGEGMDPNRINRNIIRLTGEIKALNEKHSQIGTTTARTGLSTTAPPPTIHQMKDGTIMAGDADHPGAVPGSTRTDLGDQAVQQRPGYEKYDLQEIGPFNHPATGARMYRDEDGQEVLIGTVGPGSDGNQYVMTENGKQIITEGATGDPNVLAAAPVSAAGLESPGFRGAGATVDFTVDQPPGPAGQVVAGLRKSAGQITEGLGVAGQKAVTAASGLGPPEATQDITPEESISMFNSVAEQIAKAFPEAPGVAQQMQAIVNRSLNSTTPQEREAANQEMIAFASSLLEFMDNSKLNAGMDSAIGPLSDQARAKIEALEEKGFGKILQDIITGMSRGTDPSRFNDVPAKLRSRSGLGRQPWQ